MKLWNSWFLHILKTCLLQSEVMRLVGVQQWFLCVEGLVWARNKQARQQEHCPSWERVSSVEEILIILCKAAGSHSQLINRYFGSILNCCFFCYWENVIFAKNSNILMQHHLFCCKFSFHFCFFWHLRSDLRGPLLASGSSTLKSHVTKLQVFESRGHITTVSCICNMWTSLENTLQNVRGKYINFFIRIVLFCILSNRRLVKRSALKGYRSAYISDAFLQL